MVNYLRVQDPKAATSQLVIQNFFGDTQSILKTFRKHDEDIIDYLPDEFKAFAEDIKKLRGTQLNNLIGSTLACAGSLFAFSMNGAIAAQCTSLPLELRATVAASPLLVGGFLRVFSAYQADQGRGKENILQLLSLSILGMIGNLLILCVMLKNEDLSTITPDQCFPLIVAGAFIGLGLGTYASGITLGARAAANGSMKLWQGNLQNIASLLQRSLVEKGRISSAEVIQIEPGFLSKRLSFLLRQDAGPYSAIIAGIANTSPSIPIAINAYAETFALSNSSRTALFAGIQMMAMLGIYLLLNNPVYDQLLKNNPGLTRAQAKAIARYTGQTLFASDLTFWEEIKQLTADERQELLLATILYSASYGVLASVTTTGAFTLMSRCVPRLEASLTIARAVTVSSIFRMIPLFTSLTPMQLSQLSLAVMTLALGIFAFADEKNIPESMMYIYAAFCGIVCFAVVARLIEKAPNKVGLITGASSGLGAFIGFPLSVIMAWLQVYNPVEGACPNEEPHAKTSVQLLAPIAVSLGALAYLSAPAIRQSTAWVRNRFVTFQPVASTEMVSINSQLEDDRYGALI